MFLLFLHIIIITIIINNNNLFYIAPFYWLTQNWNYKSLWLLNLQNETTIKSYLYYTDLKN